MSIAYQSWEIGSGPTVGYKIQGHQAAGDGLNFRKQQAESIPRSLTTLLYRQSQQQQQQQQQQPEAKPPVAAAPKFMPQNGVLMNGPSVNPQSQRFATGAATTTTAPSSPDRSRLASSGGTRGVVVVASVPLVAAEAVQQNEGISNNRPCSSSSSIVTSSISADSSDESDDKEVQSAFKGPLEQMDSLMTTLPRRGLSKFYAGKSRSFASLADVKSIKDLAKPDNPFNNKRRKCPSHHRDGVDRHRFPVPRISTAAAGIAKKPISSSNGTTLTLAVAMSTVGDGGDECDVPLVAGNPSIKRWQKSCRSLSLTDLEKA